MHVFASSQLPPLQYLTQPLSPSSLPTFYISFLLSSFILWFNLLFWSSSLFLSVCCHFILHSSFSHSLEWKCIKKPHKCSKFWQIFSVVVCNFSIVLQHFYPHSFTLVLLLVPSHKPFCLPQSVSHYICLQRHFSESCYAFFLQEDKRPTAPLTPHRPVHPSVCSSTYWEIVTTY